MMDKAQSDEFMKHYMNTCKEQIEKLAKNPELLSQALKPFMQMSQQLIAGGILDGTMSDIMPNMSITQMVAQMKEMVNYIKGNYKDLMKKDISQIQDLDESSRKLRVLVKRLIEKIEGNK